MRNLVNATLSIIINKYSYSSIIDNIEILNNSLINIDALLSITNKTILILSFFVLIRAIAIYRDILKISSTIEALELTFKVIISKIVNINALKI